MIDWIIKLYRRMTPAARKISIFLLAVVIALSTMHLMTFPATAMTRQAGEGDTETVIGEETDTENFDNASEGEEIVVNPVNNEETPNTEETIVPEGETPAPADPEMTEEPEITEGELAEEPVESQDPEITEEPQPTEAPAVEEVEEEPEEESDPEADVEDASDWEEMFRDIELTGVWADDLLTLAEEQIGYEESEKNFVKDDEGVKHGYTRYGAWYGEPYKAWDSLFIMFNLYYAGITKLDFPYEADCEDWVESLKEAEMYREADTYIPAKGDVVFADTDEDGEADHVAIIKNVVFNGEGRPEDLTVIEGDADNEVKESTYEFFNPLIIGFAQLPENPEQAEKAEEEVPVFTLTGSANRVDVTVEYEEGTFPEGTTMEVKTVGDRSVIEAINETVAEENKEVVRVQAVDIIFRDANGTEIEPAKPIKVTMKSRSVPQAATEKPVVVHVDETAGPAVIETSTPEDEPEDSKEAVTFEAGSFSVYAIVYTVDFQYEVNGRVYEYSLPGGGKTTLSELAETLKLFEGTDFSSTQAFMKEVESVEFSNSSLVQVTRKEDDWELESLSSFDTEETLSITMKNGNVIFIQVTDPALQNISGLLTDVNISATKNEDGSYTVYAGQPYNIDLSFKEQPNGTQFNMTDGFYYPLPQGLINTNTLTGKVMIELSGGDHAGESVELDYHLEGNNLVFTWPDQSSGAYNQLKDAIYTNFKIHIEAEFDENAEELVFSDTITKDVIISNDGKADVNKSGTYNPETNAIDYTVTVTSTGICKNVVVTDTISGSALTYNGDARATSNKGSSLPAPATSGNGFTFTIPQMGDGETVTVRYSAAVNLDAVTQNSDGSLGTVEQTGNKVTVTPSNHPGDDDELSGKDLNNKISYSTISKTGSVGETGEDGHATVTWTIKANANANVSMAGHTISDLIDPGSQSIMKYNGTGITVVRKDANGNTVGTETIPWNNLTSHSDSAWTWTVPNSSPDTGKLSYEITYTTDVDVSNQLFNTTVKNTGTSDNGGSSSGSGTVTPPGGALVARKVYIGKDMTGEEKTVTWEVNFDVPASGLDSAEIDDTMPTYWNGSSPKVDEYKDGSITITPDLAFGESYEVSTYSDSNGIEHMKVTFYKTVDEHKVTGLSGTGSKRKIRVQFKTVLNPEWLEAAETDANATTHQNNANVILNGQTLGTQASVQIDVTQPELSKTHNDETVNVVNSNTLPAWQFLITLKGVSDDTFDENGQIVLLDTYNSKYLDWYPHAYPEWEKQNGQVFGGDSNNKFMKSSADKVMSKVTDGQLKIVLNQSDLPRDENDEYYPLYTIPYYLTVKDPIALQKLIANASYSSGGAIDLYNTVSNNIFGDAEDKVTYEVPVVNKSATEPQLVNGVYKLHYTVKINERALQLGDSDELVMTDEYSNISIDYTTLKIYEYINNVKTEVHDVIWDRSGYTSTYYLKNATHYEIEYDAHLTGQGEMVDATHSDLTYTNTAEVFGRKSTWEKTKRIDSSGEGGSRTFRIKVLKHVKGNASQGLQGAKFELWWYPSTSDDPEGMNSRPDKNDPGWVNTGKTLTTDANGYAQTVNDMQIHSQTWYKLVEVEAPRGYTLKTTHYFFWITEDQVADYNKFVYVNDDVLAINNTPELPETIDVSVEKVWDDNSDFTLRKDINVHLYAEGQPYNEYFSGEWASYAREDADVTLHLNADGTTDRYTWSGLPSGYTYSVVEEPVPGYTTVYSPKNTLTGGTLKITNKRNTLKTAISIEKQWINGAKPAEDITVQLKRKISANAPVVIQNGANGAGAYGMHITDYSVPAGATVNLIWTYKNSWGYDSPALNIYNYQTKALITHQNKIMGSPTQHSLEVEVPAEGIIVAFEEPYLSSLNDFTGAFDFDMQVISSGSGETAEDTSFTNERHYLTLSPDNNWHLDVDGLLISDDDGAYTYYIEEIGVNDNTQTPEEAGYEVSYSNNDGITNGVITVSNEKESPAKIQVTKVFSGINSLPGSFQITNDYNEEVFTVSNKASGNGTTGSPYTWVIDDIPAGTEVEFTETGVTADGYILTIKANGVAQPEGSSTAKASGIAAKTPEGEQIPTVAFINEYIPKTGSLNISKSVTVPEEVGIEKANGTYSFELYKVIKTETGDETLEKVVKKADGTTDIGSLQITVAEGTPSPEILTIDGLAPGTYIVKEMMPSDNDAMMIDESVEGYDSSYGGIRVQVTAGDTSGVKTAAFTNKYETTTASVKKIWVNKGKAIPESIEMTLLANGEETDPAVTVTLTEGNGWSATVDGLDKYRKGEEITYSWKESAVPGYFITKEEVNGTETVITNTYEVYDLETSYIGKKTWIDQSDKYETRPINLKVTLQRKIDSDADWTDLTDLVPSWKNKDGDEWTYTFEHLQVFDENGNVYRYQAVETQPSGYTGETVTTPTNYSIGEIKYEDGRERVTTDNKVIWTLNTTTDLAFVAIAPTAHGNCTVWSHRVATPAEKAEIKKILDKGALPPAKGRPIDYYSGTGASVYTPHGNIEVTFDETTQTVTLDFGSTSVWSQFIVGQFKTTQDEKYNPGSADFTNTLETTELSGTKTWVIDGTEVPADPVLKLTRTVAAASDEGAEPEQNSSTVEEVEGAEPVWTGEGMTRTFTYTGLPKKNQTGSLYIYHVAEYQFTVDGVTYTVIRNDDGSFTANPDAEHAENAKPFKVIQSENAIENTEVTDFEFSKIWKDTSSQPVVWPDNLTITVKFNAYTDSDSKALGDDQILSFKPGTLPAKWTMVQSEDGKMTTFKTTGLPVTKDGKKLTYYVVEETVDAYKTPAYAGKDGRIVESMTKAENGQIIINTPEDSFELPKTGGTGTGILYSAGLILILLSGALLLRRQRRSI